MVDAEGISKFLKDEEVSNPERGRYNYVLG
jgi:hypothetical protein